MKSNESGIYNSCIVCHKVTSIYRETADGSIICINCDIKIDQKIQQMLKTAYENTKR